MGASMQSRLFQWGLFCVVYLLLYALNFFVSKNAVYKVLVMSLLFGDNLEVSDDSYLQFFDFILGESVLPCLYFNKGIFCIIIIVSSIAIVFISFVI